MSILTEQQGYVRHRIVKYAGSLQDIHANHRSSKSLDVEFSIRSERCNRLS
jgi:hypothetical protein